VLVVDVVGYIEIDRGVCSRLINEAETWESAILDAANLAFSVEHAEGTA